MCTLLKDVSDKPDMMLQLSEMVSAWLSNLQRYSVCCDSFNMCFHNNLHLPTALTRDEVNHWVNH